MSKAQLMGVTRKIKWNDKDYEMVPCLYTEGGPDFYLLAPSHIAVIPAVGQDNYDLTPSSQPALFEQTLKRFVSGVYND